MSSGSCRPPTIGVVMPPGATAFTRTPRRAYSIARVRVIASTPPLLALYAVIHGWPESADVEAAMTMEPFDSTRAGRARRVV